MARNGNLNQILRLLSFLTVLFALAFSLPPAAHASLMNNNSSDRQMQQSAGYGVSVHDMARMAATAEKEHAPGTQHESASCCSGICADLAVLTYRETASSEEVHSHVALPFSRMRSVNARRLIRPPQL